MGRVLIYVVGCRESVELCSGLWGECLGNSRASGFPLSLSERESVWIFRTAVSEGECLDFPYSCLRGRVFGFSLQPSQRKSVWIFPIAVSEGEWIFTIAVSEGVFGFSL